MATVDPYTERLRRAAIACLSTSLRHGSPQMMDALCELERAVYTDAVSPSAPEWLRARIAEALADMDNALTGPTRYHRTCADAVLAVLPPAPRYEMTDEMWSAFSSAKEAYSHGNNAETDVCDALDRMTAMLDSAPSAPRVDDNE